MIVQQMFAPETFGERQEGERSPVVSLLPRFLERLALKKSTRSVPETWGHMYDVLPRSAKGMRKWDERSDSRAAEKGAKILVSSHFRESTRIRKY